MVNPVQSITEYQGDDFADYLETLHLIDIFEDLIKEYGHDKPLLKQIVKYIVWTYSLESEHVVMGMEWGDNKKKIFESLFLPDSVWGDLVELGNVAVIKTADAWLRHQRSDTYNELTKLKDLRLEMQRSYSLPVATVSYNQKFENAVYAQKINEMIKNLNSELIQNTPKLKDAAAEVNQKKKKNTMGAEKFATAR